MSDDQRSVSSDWSELSDKTEIDEAQKEAQASVKREETEVINEAQEDVKEEIVNETQSIEDKAKENAKQDTEVIEEAVKEFEAKENNGEPDGKNEPLNEKKSVAKEDDKVIIKLETDHEILQIIREEKLQSENSHLRTKLADYQKAMINLMEAFEQVANEKLSASYHINNLQDQVNFLQTRLQQLSLESHTVTFSDPRISTSFMKRGNLAVAIENAMERIQNRTFHKFYVGATSNPEDRMRCHSKKGFQKMEILFCTNRYSDACLFESTLLNQVFYESGCTNMKNGSFGLVASKQIFYVYMLN